MEEDRMYFDSADANHDGFLDEQEFNAFHVSFIFTISYRLIKFFLAVIV